MPTIRVSAEVHAAITKEAIGALDDRQCVQHPDGSISFPISADTAASLAAISQDPEAALRRLFNLPPRWAN